MRTSEVPPRPRQARLQGSRTWHSAGVPAMGSAPVSEARRFQAACAISATGWRMALSDGLNTSIQS